MLDGTGLTCCTLQAIYEYLICLKVRELKRREGNGRPEEVRDGRKLTAT